jgi:membrane associated rhomboid family serine protease
MHRYQPNMGWGPGQGRTTPAVRALLIANVAVFLLQSVLNLVGTRPPGFHSTAWMTFIDVFGLSPPKALLGFYVWQPVTYLFLHGGLMHVGMNMLMLWIFGTSLERHWGTRQFLKYYFICGIGAGLITCALAYNSPPTIGASGAIFGLLLAYGYLWPNNVILIWGIIPMKARTMVLLFGGLELYSLVFGGSGNIAYAAHLGGMLVGFLYLKRAWRVGPFVNDLKWRLRRRRFRVMDKRDDDFPFH